MKVLFFSDIHGLDKNIVYLKSLEEKENFDQIIVLGDIYDSGIHSSSKHYNPSIIKSFLKSIKDKLVVIKGNSDFKIENDINMEYGPKTIYLDQYKVLIAHGHENELNDINNIKILIHGHNHIPYIIKDSYLNICVGSISLPRLGSKESYAIYYNGIITIYSFHNEIIDYINLEV